MIKATDEGLEVDKRLVVGAGVVFVLAVLLVVFSSIFGFFAVLGTIGYPATIIGGALLMVMYMRSCEQAAIATESADQISARLKREKKEADKKFAELWDDVFNWMTALDTYKSYSKLPLTHYGCQGRDCGAGKSELCWKCSNSVDFVVVQSSEARILGTSLRKSIEAIHENDGSAYVGIPIPWKESNENSKQLVR